MAYPSDRGMSERGWETILNKGTIFDPNSDLFGSKVNRDGSIVTPSGVVIPAVSARSNSDGNNSGNTVPTTVIPSTSAQRVSTPVSTSPMYIDAPLASKYRMDRSTAFGEEMANTAHLREIADLQAAGLNPVLSTKYGGADTVSGNAISYGSGYGSSARTVEEDSANFNSLGKFVGGVVSLFSKRPAVGNAVTKIISSVPDVTKMASNIINSAKDAKK